MKAAVLGQPISHSLSPILHSAGYRAQELSHTYGRFEVDAARLKQFVASLDSQWMGLSLTMPLKVAAFGVADVLTPLAEISGSINTLVFGEQIVGYNTDIYGIVQACAEVGLASAQSCTIIGSGATARSAIVAAKELGITHIELLARNSEAIRQCDAIATELGITLIAPAIAESQWHTSDLVINTTPANVAAELLPEVAAVSGLLLDVVYHPWPTSIASRWQLAGGAICPGYLMLLHQAVAQYELFTGIDAPVTEMRAALMEALAE
ncbi:MAG: shikimate dehydrogenase [Actinomycetes bacterium]